MYATEEKRKEQATSLLVEQRDRRKKKNLHSPRRKMTRAKKKEARRVTGCHRGTHGSKERTKDTNQESKGRVMDGPNKNNRRKSVGESL
ncbi:hypothetical protein RUM43_015117 [Polyplax serrata]|uniref:Uncharacterized protein n=1 Tax=Polyplax serrata TaxID=468196 RepID=A0AAN8RYM7_POLSC